MEWEGHLFSLYSVFLLVVLVAFYLSSYAYLFI